MEWGGGGSQKSKTSNKILHMKLAEIPCLCCKQVIFISESIHYLIKSPILVYMYGMCVYNNNEFGNEWGF